MTNQKTECEMPECHKPREKYRHLCAMHRSRKYVYGDVNYQRPSTLEKRLRERVHPTGPDDCWPFLGTITAGGYGVITDFGKNLMAHKAYYQMTVGPIEPGLWLDHMCHNAAYLRGECSGGSTCEHRRCCNPAHLQPSTPQENTRRGASPTAVIARMKKGVMCPCGCKHLFDPTALRNYDMPED